MNRRRILALLGGSLTTAAAGCLGDEDDEADQPPEDDTDTDDEPVEDEDDEAVDDDDEDDVELAPAESTLSILGTNSPVDAGEVFQVDVEVTNVGDELLEDTLTGSISPNGVGVFDSVPLEIEGGRSHNVTLEWETEAEVVGDFDVSVSTADASATTSVTVELVIEADVEIDVGSNVFDPALVQVDPGDTVLWKHAGGVHTVTFYHEDNGTQHRMPTGIDALDEDVADGDKVAHEFTEPGVYHYFCRPHEAVGMVGAIVVGTNDNPDQPGLAPPGNDIPDSAADALVALNEDIRDILGIHEPQTVVVEAANGAFSPPSIHVQPGDTIRWVGGSVGHTVTFYHEDVEIPLQDEDEVEPGEEIETEPRQHRVPEGVDLVDAELQAGAEFQLTVSTEGVYDYFCRPHEEVGMVGTFVVGEHSDPDQPGLQEPDDTIPSLAADHLRELNIDGYAFSNIPLLQNVVPEANEVFEHLNSDEESSLTVMNNLFENEEPVELIGLVEAETEAEAQAEAARLREEAVRLNDEIFTKVPKEIVEQAGLPVLDHEEINSPDDARNEADSLEEEFGEVLVEEATAALRAAADLTELIINELHRFADLLEEAIVLD